MIKSGIITLLIGLVPYPIHAQVENREDTALSLYRQGQLTEAILEYQEQLNHLSDPQKRLVLLNNFWLALDSQYHQQLRQKQYLEAENQSLLPLEQEITLNRRLATTVLNEATALADSSPPDTTVAQTYLKAENWSKAKNILLTLPLTPQNVSLRAELAHKTENIQLLENTLPLTSGWQRAEILFILAQLDSKYLSEAISTAQAQQADEYLFQLWSQQASQQPQIAQESLKLAIYSLSRLRPQLASAHPYTQEFFREQVIPVYRQYLRVLLENPSPENLKEARRIFDRFQIAQVENLLNQLCITQENQAIEQYLGENQAVLLQVIVLDSDYHLLATFPSGKIVHSRTQDSQLKENLLTWRKQLKNPRKREYLEIGAKFYQTLIDPIKEQLETQKIKQLIGSLDDDFRSIPLQAFWDRQNQQFLIEQYAISQTLSLDFLDSLETREKAWLGFGLSEARPPFNTPLPFVETELKEIAEIIPSSTLVYNENFTLAQIRQDLLLKKPPIVHLATHAQFTGNPQTSLIATYNQNLNLFELEKVLSLSPIQLLVLSACETSQGNNLATLGLAGMAAQSGVDTTLGTLWKADDFSMAQTMQQFYGFLAQGDSVAISLQKTQIQQIKQQKHPRTWALFLLLGD